MKRFNPLDTIREVLGLYALTLVVVTTVVCRAEHWSAFDGVWWALVTASTTGYGDISPHTAIGRYAAMTLMVLAWFFNVMLTALVSAKLIVNSDAWTHDEQEEIKTLLRELRDR